MSDPLKKPRQSRSILCIIIDTCKTSNDCSKEKLKETIDEWYTKEIERSIKFLGDKKGLKYIDSIEMECILDVNKTSKTVTSKILTDISHRSKIQMDQGKIRKYFREKLGSDLKLCCRCYGNLDETKGILKQLDVESMAELK